MPRQSNWRVLIHLAAFLTAAVGVYTLLGFLVLPYWIERKLPELAEGIAAQVSVEDVSANPFLFTLSARRLEVAQQDGTAVLQVPEVSLDIGLESLVERALVVQRIEAHEPRLSLVLGPEGRFNVVELFRSTKPTPAGSASTPATSDEAAREDGLPPVLVQSLVIDRAWIEYVDRSRSQARRLVIAPLTLNADGLSTRLDESGRVRLDARVADSGTVSAEGSLSMQPFRSEGSVRIEHLPLAPVVALAMTADNAIEPPAGSLDLAFRYHIPAGGGAAGPSLTDLSATIANFALHAAGSETPMVAWSDLSAGGGSVDLETRAIALDSVGLREGRIAARVDADGQLNVARIAAAFAGPDAEPEPAGDPWQVRVASIQGQGIELLYADRSPGFPIEARVAGADLRLALEASFGGAGAEVRAGDIGLSLQDVRAQHPGSEEALTLAALHVEGGQVDTRARSVSAAELRFDDLSGTVVRDAAGRIGLPGAAAAFPEAAPVAATHEADEPSRASASAPRRTEGERPSAAPGESDWQIRVDRLAGNAQALGYRDQSNEPTLSASVGKTELALALEVATGGTPRVAVSGLDARMSEMTLETLGTDGKIELGRLALEQGAIDTAAQRFAAKGVTLAGGRLGIIRKEDGALEIAGIALPEPAGTTAGRQPDAQAEGPAWDYDIGMVRVDDLELALTDRSFRNALAYDLTLAAALHNVSSAVAKPIQAEASVRASQGGTLRAEGTVSQDFSAGSVRLKLDALALTPLDPLLAEYALLKVVSGTASGNAQLRFGGADGPRLQAEGDLRVAEVLVNEIEGGKPFVSWKSVDARGITVGIEPNRLEIAEVSIVAPEAELIVSEKRTLNLTRIVREVEQETPDAAAPEEDKAPFPIQVGRITLKEGTLQFADLSLVLPFSTRVHTLEGVIVGLSSAPEARAELQLDGLIEDYGSASASGAVNAFDPTRFMDIGAQFDNVLIPPFSPYTATFAGRTIESGRLWLDLDYRIVAGELAGENKIVVQNLKLGERVEAANAADWPLDLALALLKDSQGRISMEIPVSGDVGDPQFDYGKVIRNAVGSALKSIVSAPFRALASLFGGRDVEEVRQVLFNPGSDRLLPAEQQQLQQVAKALQARPELRLLVHGPYDPVQDARALRERAVRRTVAEALNRPVAPPQVPDPIAFTDPQTQRVLEALLAKRLSEEDLAVFRSIIGPSDPEYYHAIFGELAARVDIPDSALQALANERARAVARVLVENGVEPNRVAAAEARRVNGEPSPAIAATLDLAAGETG